MHGNDKAGEDPGRMTRKELEERYLDVLQSRDRIFAIASHDLRSPFSGLLGVSRMLCDSLDEFNREDLKEYVETLHESIRNTYQLLENLFEWGKVERGRYETVVENVAADIIFNEVVSRFTGEIAHKEQTINGDFDKEMVIRANYHMLEFVLRNFISNAIKFTPRGGLITVSFRSKGGGAVVSVRDNGTGISPANRKKLFRLDTSWKCHGTEGEAGTGIGLLTSKRFADYYGARIEIDSEEGSGSTFSLILPENPA